MDERVDRNYLIYSVSRKVLLEKIEKNEKELIKFNSENYLKELNNLKEINLLQVKNYFFKKRKKMKKTLHLKNF